LVQLVVRVLFVLAPTAVAIGLAFTLQPALATLRVGSIIAALAIGAATSHLIDQNRALMAEDGWLQTGAALLQAGFYTIYIAGALFAFVVHTPLWFSGVVTANLFGWLFWRFRRRYSEALDEASESPQLPGGGA
ncbi:MAG: hypothetical protein ACHQX4_03280, partial [Gemmatimonadales bacterium]